MGDDVPAEMKDTNNANCLHCLAVTMATNHLNLEVKVSGEPGGGRRARRGARVLLLQFSKTFTRLLATLSGCVVGQQLQWESEHERHP